MPPEALEHLRDDRLRAVLVEDGRELVHEEDVFLQRLDGLLGSVRHELHDKAARGLDAAVRVHEHAERARRAELVALGEERRKVLGNLTAHERGGAGVRLAQADVAADREKTRFTDRAGDVELAVPLADG